MGSKQRLRAERRQAQTAEKQNLSVKFSVSDEPEESGIEVDLGDGAGSSQVSPPVEQETLPAGSVAVEIDLPPDDEDDGEDPIEALVRRKKELDESRQATEDARKEKADTEARFQAEAQRKDAEREAIEAKWRDEKKRRDELEGEKIKRDREELVHHQAILEHAYREVDAERIAAEQEFAQAAAAGEYEKFGELQTKISRTVLRQTQIEEGYQRLKEKIEAPLPEFVREPEPAPVQSAQTTTQADPFEAFLATSGLVDADKNYLRSRKDFINASPDNPVLLQSIANVAEKRYKLKPGTAEYHAFIDENLGLTEAENDDEPEDVQPVVAPAPALKPIRPAVAKRPTAAPGSRATSSSSPSKVFLTEWDREQAKTLGVSEKEYATYKARASEGQLTPAQAGGRLMSRYTA